ncbi:MAG: DNA replication/repair protein RecF [Candidatus Heteroscillospira sp.]|jgi:DNA replication and repair protein RecF
MQIDRIELEDFRSYARGSFEFSSGVNVITGENAQGKTNLLESIYLLTGARSWRTRFDKELIRFDSPQARICAYIEAEGRNQKIEMLLRRGQRRKILKNGVSHTAAELSGTVNAVLFCPEDLGIVREGAQARRRFMDAALNQLRPQYAELTARYSRLYEHKSAALRSAAERPDLLLPLDDISDQMCALSAKIIRYRASFVRRLGERAAEIHSEFSGCREALELRYKTVSTVTDPFAPASELYGQITEHQRAHRRAELESVSCLTGVHKDDIEIFLNGVPARQFASQGQTRTAALSMKMAERLLFLEETGQPPLLLLDDVLSELDEKRQEFVLNRVGGGQTFITCCEGAEIARRTGGRVLTIVKGGDG